MLEVFDGFIAAVSTETKIPLKKEGEGRYSAVVDFEGGRHQNVLITLDEDNTGDPIISFFSIIQKGVKENLRLYKDALTMNASLTYGAIALTDDALIVQRTYWLQNMDPQRFIKSLIFVAAKADELEEILNPAEDQY